MRRVQRPADRPGPPRPTGYPGSVRDGVIVLLVFLAAVIALGLWQERTVGPGRLASARAALDREGFAGAEVRRRWIACPQKGSGYRWRTPAAEGYVCVGRSGAKVAVTHRREARP